MGLGIRGSLQEEGLSTSPECAKEKKVLLLPVWARHQKLECVQCCSSWKASQAKDVVFASDIRQQDPAKRTSLLGWASPTQQLSHGLFHTKAQISDKIALLNYSFLAVCKDSTFSSGDTKVGGLMGWRSQWVPEPWQSFHFSSQGMSSLHRMISILNS